MPRARKRCQVRGCDNQQPCADHPRHRREVRTKSEVKRRAVVYGQEHRDERARWVPVVATGTVPCRRAGNGTCIVVDGGGSPLIDADDTTWQLGHPDAECRAPRAPEHRRCNTATRNRPERERV